jgi:hypothetical protein
MSRPSLGQPQTSVNRTLHSGHQPTGSHFERSRPSTKIGATSWLNNGSIVPSGDEVLKTLKFTKKKKDSDLESVQDAGSTSNAFQKTGSVSTSVSVGNAAAGGSGWPAQLALARTPKLSIDNDLKPAIVPAHSSHQISSDYISRYGTPQAPIPAPSSFPSTSSKYSLPPQATAFANKFDPGSSEWNTSSTVTKNTGFPHVSTPGASSITMDPRRLKLIGDQAAKMSISAKSADYAAQSHQPPVQAQISNEESFGRGQASSAVVAVPLPINKNIFNRSRYGPSSSGVQSFTPSRPQHHVSARPERDDMNSEIMDPQPSPADTVAQVTPTFPSDLITDAQRIIEKTRQENEELKRRVAELEQQHEYHARGSHQVLQTLNKALGHVVPHTPTPYREALVVRDRPPVERDTPRESAVSLRATIFQCCDPSQRVQELY